MIGKYFLSIFFVVAILTSCSPYIPLTKELIKGNKLTTEDLKLLQFYSYSSDIIYKGTDIKKTSEGIKRGELYKGEQIERNYIIIPERTAGMAKKIILDNDDFPIKIQVLYDNDIPTLSYELGLQRQTSKDYTSNYLIRREEITIDNAIYTIQEGYKTKIFVNSEELNKLIENKKFAKGIRVKGTKLKRKKEIINE